MGKVPYLYLAVLIIILAFAEFDWQAEMEREWARKREYWLSEVERTGWLGLSNV